MVWSNYNGIEYVSNKSYKVGIINQISIVDDWYVGTDGYKDELLCMTHELDKQGAVNRYLNKNFLEV